MVLFVSAILLTCVLADGNIIRGPVGSVSNLLKQSRIYNVFNKTLAAGPIKYLQFSGMDNFNNKLKTEFFDRIKYDVSNDMYPSIENLNHYLKPFEKCFVHITNYGSVEIHQTAIPIVLTEITTQLVSSHTKYETNEYIQHVPKQSQPKYSRAENFKPNHLSCTSRFLVKSSLKTFYNGHCLQINHTKFVTNIRPWSCEVHFDVFASLYRTKSHEWTELDKNFHTITMNVYSAPVDLWFYHVSANISQSIHKLTPSTMLVIRINVIMDIDSEKWFNSDVYSDWIHAHVNPNRFWWTRGSREGVEPKITNEVYIAMLTKNINQSATCNITKVLAIKQGFNVPDNGPPYDPAMHKTEYLTQTEITFFKTGTHCIGI